LQPAARHAPWLVPAGFAIGFVVGSLCGIGGGLFAVPLLHAVHGLELRRAVATGLVLVLATTAAATLTEWIQGAPSTSWTVLLGLVPGAFVGALLGYRVAERTSVRNLKRVFVVVLVLAAARILLGGSGGGPALAADVALSRGAAPLAFLVGIGGGFVAPLLGVGGGLLMVPGLFLGIPGLASLAAGAVAAARSLRRHGRAGRVEWGTGLRLGAGAVLGAAVGVLVGRDPLWVEAGRVGLGLLLLGVAGRFARDLARGQA
jgi:uncharacterized membrane protein YfcA